MQVSGRLVQRRVCGVTGVTGYARAVGWKAGCLAGSVPRPGRRGEMRVKSRQRGSRAEWQAVKSVDCVGDASMSFTAGHEAGVGFMFELLEGLTWYLVAEWLEVSR